MLPPHARKRPGDRRILRNGERSGTTDKAGVRQDPERENREILNRYRGLLRAIRGRRSPE